MWLLRLGYFRLHKPIEPADDWFYMLDYVIGTDGKDDVDMKLGSGNNSRLIETKVKLTKGSGKVEFNQSYNVADVQKIFKYLMGDDDKAKIDKDIMINASIYGGDGKDKLDGG